MTNQETRSNKSKIACHHFEELMAAKNIPYRKTGMENIFDDEFRFKIYDTKPNFLKFFPDYTIIVKNLVHLVEVKATKTIDIEAYQQYIKINKAGIKVILFIFDYGYTGKLFIQDIDKIQFIGGTRTDKGTRGTGKPYRLIDKNSLKVIR